MKHKLILALALSALVLSACNSDNIQDTAVEADDSEIYTTGSYQLQFSESLAAKEEEAEETSETEAADTAETEPAEETEEARPETAVPDGEPYRFIDMTSRWRNTLAGNGLICSPESKEDHLDLNFIDITENKIVNTVSLPAGFSIDGISTGSGDVLVKVVHDNYDYETQTVTRDVVIVHDSYEAEYIKDASPEELWFEHYGHKIAKSGLDLVCLDGEPEVIVAGSYREDDEYGFYTQTQYYLFPIDENRFVYRTGGYESLPGFGIYDFGTKTAKDVPDSRDLIPFGVHDGKVYSVKTAWDGYGSEIYVTDIETLETSFFMDFQYNVEPIELNEYVQYFMPESGNYILTLKEDRSDEWMFGVKDSYYRIDPDTAEAEFICQLPENFYFTGFGYFVDENTFAANGDSDKDYTMLILELDQ